MYKIPNEEVKDFLTSMITEMRIIADGAKLTTVAAYLSWALVDLEAQLRPRS
jgi:hypothetical protein